MKDGRTLLNEFYMHYKKDHREGGEYLGSLSSEEFKRILELPVGMPRSYLSQMRKSFKKSTPSKYIIHIPHASLDIPKDFKKNLLVPEGYFNKENIFISDYKVDNFVPNNFPNIVKFKYSRMFCDVEKYLDDSQEEMSKYGMGALYTKDSNGKEFVKRNKKDDEYIINNYYKKHHQELDNMVEKLLTKYKNPIIIDLHSFSDEFVSKVLNKNNCPDICIGINKDNYDINLLEKTINHFSKYDYSVQINYPYSGSITSNKYPQVISIMIEINKRVYQNNNYDKFYSCMMEYYKIFDIME